jgi:hypothetical protein
MKVRVHNGVEVTTLVFNNNDIHMEVDSQSVLFLNQYERGQLLDALALETIEGKGMEVGNAMKETTQTELIDVPEVSQEDVNADLATDIYKAEGEL